MNQSARVNSLDALKSLHAALAHYGPVAQEALGAAAMEIRRFLDWLQGQLKYWQRQVDRRREDVGRARSDLAHARAMRQGERSGYVEQELALRKANNRLREAEDKVAAVKRWLVHLPQAINEYNGPARRLASLLEADLQNGLTVLENKITILEAYAAVQVAEPPPSAPRPPQGGTS